jgi:hypothetical protein
MASRSLWRRRFTRVWRQPSFQRVMHVAIGCLFLWVATACASGARAQDAPPLSRDDRIDLLNAVLDSRAQLFGQPVYLLACDLSRDLDLGPDFVTRIDQRWRGRLWGGPAR